MLIKEFEIIKSLKKFDLVLKVCFPFFLREWCLGLFLRKSIYCWRVRCFFVFKCEDGAPAMHFFSLESNYLCSHRFEFP